MAINGLVPADPSPAVAIALAFARAWSDLDMDEVVGDLCAPDFTSSVLPEFGMGIPSTHSIDDFLLIFNTAFAERFTSFNMEILEIVESTASDRVVILTGIEAASRSGRTHHEEYCYVFNLRYRDDGKPEIIKVSTFGDSQAVSDFFLGEDPSNDD